MSARLKIAFFGSSLVSAHYNAAAGYFRGIVRALHTLGHDITFYEPDSLDRQRHRDITEPPWARVVVYPATDEESVRDAALGAKGADVIVKASGVGVFDEVLESAVLDVRGSRTVVAFWDVDAPNTLERVVADPDDPLRALVPRYDLVLTRGGGAPIVRGYEALGARRCVPVHDAVEPSRRPRGALHPTFEADLGLLRSRSPDPEGRVQELFFDVARGLRGRRFLLGGSGWSTAPMPRNVRYAGPVGDADRDAFDATPRAALVLSSGATAAHGPAPRMLAAAGAGACAITHDWDDIGLFLEPGREVLVARNRDDVAAFVDRLDGDAAAAIGRAARARVLAHHSYADRARDVEAELTGRGRSTP